MVVLLPGASAQHTSELLQAAVIDASNVRGSSATDLNLVNAYRGWAHRQARALASGLSADEIDRLVLTDGYARLLQLDPHTYGTGVAEPVLLELENALDRLRDARAQIDRRQVDWQIWRHHFGGQPDNAVMLDTNVLLRHCGRLVELDWQEPLGLWSHDPIALGVPLVVVEELDRLKTAIHKMHVDGVEVPVRALARAALKRLDEWFGDSSTRSVLRKRTAADHDRSELSVQLVLDDLRHVRLPTPDAEIIDRTLALRPYAKEVALATNNRAMRFSARHAGLIAFDPKVRDPSRLD